MKTFGNVASRLRRSVLITPGDREDMLIKAAESAADACILEWEDGIHESRREGARKTSTTALRELNWGYRERVIRINGPRSPHVGADIDAAVGGGVDAIMIPKVRDAEDVRGIAEQIANAEATYGLRDGSTRIWVMIETARALVHVEEIAGSGPRMTAMLFGGADLGAELKLKKVSLGANRLLGPIRYEYIYAYSRLVIAARVAGIDPIAMPYTTYSDLKGTRREAEFCAQFGFEGSLAVSPRQLRTINEAFSPSGEDIEWAARILAEVETATEQEESVIVVAEEMADEPFFRSARQIRDLQARIDAVAGR